MRLGITDSSFTLHFIQLLLEKWQKKIWLLFRLRRETSGLRFYNPINLRHPEQLKIPKDEKTLDNCGWEIVNHMTYKDCQELEELKILQN